MQRGDYSAAPSLVAHRQALPANCSTIAFRPNARSRPGATARARIPAQRLGVVVRILPCEHPLLNELARNKTVTLIGLNYKDQRLNAPPGSRTWVIRMNQSERPRDGSASRSATPWRTGTFVIDKEGVIRYKHIRPAHAGGAAEQKLLLTKRLSPEKGVKPAAAITLLPRLFHHVPHLRRHFGVRGNSRSSASQCFIASLYLDGVVGGEPQHPQCARMLRVELVSRVNAASASFDGWRGFSEISSVA